MSLTVRLMEAGKYTVHYAITIYERFQWYSVIYLRAGYVIIANTLCQNNRTQ